MAEKTEISAQRRDTMATIVSFMAVTNEYADKTSKYNTSKIYGGNYLYDNGTFSDPQAEYMEDLRQNTEDFKKHIINFMNKYPEIPISAYEEYLDNDTENPHTHHHPSVLRITADFPKKQNEIATVRIMDGDYRGIPTIKMTFGKKTLYEEAFGRKYEDKTIRERIAESLTNAREHIIRNRESEIVHPSPVRKITDIPVIAKFINWLTDTKD